MMFDFGGGGAGVVDPACLALAAVSGSLIIDSGEEDATFVFRCQDRYVTYTSLAQMRTLLFVVDDSHAAVYESCLERVRHNLRAVSERTGVLRDAVIPDPLYVAYDVATGRVSATAHTQAAFDDPAQVRSLIAGVRANQISPTYGHLLAGTARACAAARPGWDTAGCERQAALALRLHDKAHYAELLRAAGPEVAPHVATALLDPEALFAVESWSDLFERAGLPADALSLHVKSSLDSGGNVAAVLAPDDVGRALARLQAEWLSGSLIGADARAARVELNARKVAASWTLAAAGLDDGVLAAAVDRQAEVRAAHRVRMLVQPRLQPPASGRAASVGWSFVIGEGAIAPACVAEQTFVDAQRRKHLGSVLDARAERDLLASADRPGFSALCELFAATGYRGPINFDAVLDGDGRYVGVLDCNPRLTAVYPAIAVREALRAEGDRCDTIVNLDYRGLYRWPDAGARLAALDDAGLLYTRATPRGVLPLPSLANEDGFDLHLVNLARTEIEAVLRSDLLGEATDFDKGTISRVYR